MILCSYHKLNISLLYHLTDRPGSSHSFKEEDNSSALVFIVYNNGYIYTRRANSSVVNTKSMLRWIKDEKKTGERKEQGQIFRIYSSINRPFILSL